VLFECRRLRLRFEGVVDSTGGEVEAPCWEEDEGDMAASMEWVVMPWALWREGAVVSWQSDRNLFLVCRRLLTVLVTARKIRCAK
jgi:hypothetical protein